MREGRVEVMTKFMYWNANGFKLVVEEETTVNRFGGRLQTRMLTKKQTFIFDNEEKSLIFKEAKAGELMSREKKSVTTYHVGNMRQDYFRDLRKALKYVIFHGYSATGAADHMTVCLSTLRDRLFRLGFFYNGSSWVQNPRLIQRKRIIEEDFETDSGTDDSEDSDEEEENSG